MNIDATTLQRIAHLARLDFEGKDAADMISSMTEILDWVEKLNELDTDGVEPLTNMSQELNVLRQDQVVPPLSHQDGLKNAPQKDSNYFRVPKVLE